MKRSKLMIPAAALVIIVALFLSNGNRGEGQGTETLTGQCTVAVYCGTALQNIDLLSEEKRELIPADGVLLQAQTVAFAPGESAFDVLQRALEDAGVHIQYNGTAAQQTAYIQAIGNLYELDCGERSGWLYYVNRAYPEAGISQQIVAEGDLFEWIYTCDYGEDIALEPLD